MNVRLGRISQRLTPSYGFCGRCQTSWRFVQGHHTYYTPSRGCFPLCEKCWTELLPVERLPYYRRLWLAWTEQDEQVWEQIETAVLGETQGANR